MYSKTAKKIFVIGGSDIYKAVLETGRVDKMIVSHIAGSHEGDTYFEVLKVRSVFGNMNLKNMNKIPLV